MPVLTAKHTETVMVAGDPTPMLLTVVHRIRRRCAESQLGRTSTHSAKGVVQLRSSGDKQAVALEFDDGTITARSGVYPADLEFEVAWTDPHIDPDHVANVSSEHSLLAVAVSTLLAHRPCGQTWMEAGEDFWIRTKSLPGMPSLKVVSTDDKTAVQLGEGTSSTYEIHGSDEALSAVLSGHDLFLTRMLDGDITVLGGFAQFSLIVGASLKVVLGEC